MHNPIIKTVYTADPAPAVFGDNLYLLQKKSDRHF